MRDRLCVINTNYPYRDIDTTIQIDTWQKVNGKNQTRF